MPAAIPRRVARWPASCFVYGGREFVRGFARRCTVDVHAIGTASSTLTFLKYESGAARVGKLVAMHVEVARTLEDETDGSKEGEPRSSIGWDELHWDARGKVSSIMVGGHMTNVIPQEGRWYAYRGNRELYQVINVDDNDRVIYFQDSRGDIDEVDFDEWSAMDLELLTDLEELDQFGEDEQDEYRPDDYRSDYGPARPDAQAARR